MLAPPCSTALAAGALAPHWPAGAPVPLLLPPLVARAHAHAHESPFAAHLSSPPSPHPLPSSWPLLRRPFCNPYNKFRVDLAYSSPITTNYAQIVEGGELARLQGMLA